RGQQHEKYLWDTATGKHQSLPPALADSGTWLLAGPDRDAFLALDETSQTVTLRDWPSGRPRHTFSPPTPTPPATGYQTTAAATDGRVLAVIGEDRRGGLRATSWV